MKKFNLAEFNIENRIEIIKTDFLNPKVRYQAKYTDKGIIFINEFGKAEFNLLKITGDLIKVENIEPNVGGKFPRITLRLKDIKDL